MEAVSVGEGKRQTRGMRNYVITVLIVCLVYITFVGGKALKKVKIKVYIYIYCINTGSTGTVTVGGG